MVTEDMRKCINEGVFEPHMGGICGCHVQDWEMVGVEGKDLLKRMFTVNVEERISASGILKHPFITGS